MRIIAFTVIASLEKCKVPDKPIWYGRLPEVIAELRNFPWPWVDRQTLQDLLGVGRRRAQQILQPCVARQIGASGVADRDELIAHLTRLAASEEGYYERRRRQKLAEVLNGLRHAALHQPAVFVEAPVAIVNQKLENLPEGVSVSPGCIRIQFSAPHEALEKLLALAMAIGNDLNCFEQAARGD